MGHFEHAYAGGTVQTMGSWIYSSALKPEASFGMSSGMLRRDISCRFIIIIITSVLVPKCPDTSDHGKVSQRHKAVTRRVHWSRESASQLDWLQRIQDGCCSASSNTCIHVCIPIRRRFPLQFANSYFANGLLSNAVRAVHTML